MRTHGQSNLINFISAATGLENIYVDELLSARQKIKNFQIDDNDIHYHSHHTQLAIRAYRRAAPVPLDCATAPQPHLRKTGFRKVDQRNFLSVKDLKNAGPRGKTITPELLIRYKVLNFLKKWTNTVLTLIIYRKIIKK
jgi:hypothetical protein